MLLRSLGRKTQNTLHIPRMKQLKGQEFLGNMEKGGTSSSKAESCASPQPGEVFNPSHLSYHQTAQTPRLLTQHPQVETAHQVHSHFPAGTFFFAYPQPLVGIAPLTTATYLLPLAEAALLLSCTPSLLTQDSCSDRDRFCGQ